MPTTHDVFLSHSSADEPAVEDVARRLQNEANLHPFLGSWHLVPGESWIPALERAISTSRSVAVFIGPKGMGAWHNEEKQLALVYSVQKRDLRVIPVLLPGARSQDIEGFLRTKTWVDLAEPDGFARLVAGITGQAPSSSRASSPGRTWAGGSACSRGSEASSSTSRSSAAATRASSVARTSWARSTNGSPRTSGGGCW